MKRFLYIVLLLCLSSIVFGQTTISRQVIGSTGTYHVGTTMTLSSTVGEPAVQTLFSVNSILTQGFQQVERTIDSIVEYEVINESCPGANNGSIFINDVLGCSGPYAVEVYVAGDTVNLLAADTLATGNYDVSITGTSGCSYQASIYVGLDSDEDCTLKFYTGITPNGDGNNDIWIIDNIEQFPVNKVKIFNRWGEQVWVGESYDNADVVWIGENDGGIEMGTGTYFYVADVGGETYKGWVELTR